MRFLRVLESHLVFMLGDKKDMRAGAKESSGVHGFASSLTRVCVPVSDVPGGDVDGCATAGWHFSVPYGDT